MTETARRAGPVSHGRVLQIALPIVISNATVPILGAVDVEIEGSLPVIKPLDLEVDADQRVALLVDLNAATWLEAVDPDTHVVDPAVFANAIGVVVR